MLQNTQSKQFETFLVERKANSLYYDIRIILKVCFDTLEKTKYF